MTLCKCGCGNKTINKYRNGKLVKYIRGHNSRIKPTHKLLFYPIPDLCKCGCKEIVYNGNQWINGHYTRINNPFKYINLSGENNPNFGKHPSEQIREKMSSAHKNKKMSDKCKEKMSISRKKRIGNLAPGWQGGKSFEPYCEKFNEKKKEEIRNQYGRKCYVCDKLESEQKKEQKERGKRQFRLSVHHTDFDKEQGCNGKVWKLVPTCIHCHNSKKMRILCV